MMAIPCFVVSDSLVSSRGKYTDIMMNILVEFLINFEIVLLHSLK